MHFDRHLGLSLLVVIIVVVVVDLLEAREGRQLVDGVHDALDPRRYLHQQRRHGEDRHGVHQGRRLCCQQLRGQHGRRQRPHVALQLLHGRVHVRHREVQCPGRGRSGHGGHGARRLPEHPRAPRAHPGAHVAEEALHVRGCLDLGARAAAQGLHAVGARAHRGAHLGVLRVGVAEAEAPVRGLPPRQVRLRVLRRLGVEHALVPVRLGLGALPRGRRRLLRREVVLDAGLHGVGELVHVPRGEEVQLRAGPHGADEHADGEAQEDADGDGGQPLLRQRRELVDAVPRHGHQAVGQDEDGHAVVEPRFHRRDEPREGGGRSCMHMHFWC